MQEMRNLNEQGLITDCFMQALEDDFKKVKAEAQAEAFLKEKSGDIYGNDRGGNNAAPKIMNKGKRKRLQKAQKKARKLQRA
jgi:hypothetical protein